MDFNAILAYMTAMKAGTLMQLIAERARNDPDAVALLAPGRPSLTYGALVREVAQTAESLAAAGLGRGSRIGLALPNGPEMALMLVAATDCATCAPLNPALDAASCRYLLECLRVDALVVPEGEDSPARQVASTMALPIVELTFSPDEPAGRFALTSRTARPAVVVTAPPPEDIALLLHTSGTTGKPKVVPYTCRNVVESAIKRAVLVQLTSADRGLLVAPMFTATGIRRNLFPALGAGGSIVCTPGFDARAFVDWLEKFQPTFYTGGPTVHRAVLGLLERRGSAPRHSLRFIVAASAPLQAEVQDRLETAIGVPVVQGYASSEGGAIAQMPLPPGPRRTGSVGLPAGSEVAILGDAGASLPVGGIGEVVVRSDEVIEGYENNPEANQQAFFNGWFRTGDLGYFDDDGFLFLKGRVKELINRGGFKVSPLEVDATLMGHPEVAEAATFAVPHPTLSEDVAAAVVLRNPGSVTPQELRDFALAGLAPFKVPSRIVLVQELPKTALGKIRRRDLADTFGSSARREVSPTVGPTEELVARIFAEELGIDAVGALDNFFELGGDSLRGAQVVARLNAALGSNLTASSLFKRPTVAEFAAELAASATAGQRSGPPPIVRRPRERHRSPSTNGQLEE